MCSVNVFLLIMAFSFNLVIFTQQSEPSASMENHISVHVLLFIVYTATN